MSETEPVIESPLRPSAQGSLLLAISTSRFRVEAGSNFSIFITIQNQYNVPITLFRTQTHIPAELVDDYWLSIRLALPVIARKKDSFVNINGISGDSPWYKRLIATYQFRKYARQDLHGGIATALDMEAPWLAKYARKESKISRIGDQDESDSNDVNRQSTFEQYPYKWRFQPIVLQPGDKVVRQFVLRTRKWLFFTPLAHQFHIQTHYSVEGVKHMTTITHEQVVQASFKAVVIGGIVGAIVGSLLKSLTSGEVVDSILMLKAMGTSILAAAAVVVAFSRKSGIQPIVSVEDFWGGALIGFSTGFFGFERFINLFGNGS